MTSGINFDEHTEMLESNDEEPTVSINNPDESKSLEFNKSGVLCI